MKFKKACYGILGCLGVALGAIGAAVPLLPSFPFLMLAALCFAKSSRRLHTWFTGTKLYRDNLADYVAGKGMTRAAKRRVMLTVTAMMAIGCAVMMRKALYIPCIILGSVWGCHILYVVFGVKTKTATEVFES